MRPLETTALRIENIFGLCFILLYLAVFSIPAHAAKHKSKIQKQSAKTTTEQATNRSETPFNDQWQFSKGALTASNLWEDVQLPHTWNAVDMQTKKDDFYEGEAQYRRSYTPSLDLKNKRVFLRFEGVGQVARLFVNGHLVGSHRGAYSGFVFEITHFLKWGKANEIVLEADNHSRDDIIPINHFLFGVYGGIYRPVSLIVTDANHLKVAASASSNVAVRTLHVDAQRAEIEVDAVVENMQIKAAILQIEHVVKDAKENIVMRQKEQVRLPAQSRVPSKLSLRIDKPHLWNGIADPYQYHVESSVYRGKVVVDQVTTKFGVRDIQLRAGDGVYLNGKKIPMYGVARHQDRWGKGSALSNADHDEDLALMREMGVTTVRFAHYQQSDYLYSRCDELGLLVWAEIPFVNKVSTKEADNAKSQLRELIEQSRNHPSIYIWGLHNEVYKPDDYTKQLTHDLHMLAKSLDPNRLTVSVNGYGNMDHAVNRQADVQGMNRYYGWYEGKIGDLQGWASGLANQYPNEKLILSEYGAEANVNHQSELTGDRYDYQSSFYPEGFGTKSHEQEWSIIQRNPNILASYVWNMFDFAVPRWERGGVPARNMKGLVTFDRQLKKDAFYWYKANWSKDAVLYITGRRAVQRERQSTDITVYSNQGIPSISVNGQLITNVEKGETDVHFIARNVSLQPGKNVIVASNPKGHRDEIVWIYEKDSDNRSQR